MAIPIATGIMHLSGYEFQIEIAIAIGIESMGLGDEKMDVGTGPDGGMLSRFGR